MVREFAAVVGFKQKDLRSGLKCKGWLKMSNFTRPEIPDRRPSKRHRKKSPTFSVKLQTIQSSAAKLVLKARKSTRHVHENLHWLPSRINYKLSAICHNFFSDSSLSDPLLTVYTYFRRIRSSAEIHTVRPPCYSENKNLTHTQHREDALTLTSLVVPPQPEAMEFSPVSVTSFSLPIPIQNCATVKKEEETTTTTKNKKQKTLYKH